MNEDLEELRRLLEKATPGPYALAFDGPIGTLVKDGTSTGVRWIAKFPLDDMEAQTNALLTLKAFEYLPALLDELSHLRGEVERMREALVGAAGRCAKGSLVGEYLTMAIALSTPEAGS